jgi:hypothetical protein
VDDEARILTDALGEAVTREDMRQLADYAFIGPTVRLYDQFGRPVYVPSTAPKIGSTISVKRPRQFGAPSQ